MKRSTRLLSRENIKRYLEMPTCLDIVEKVLKEQGEGRVVMPPKLFLDMNQVSGWINAMPAYLISQKAAGLKWAGGWAGNAEKGLPYIMGEIFLINAETGSLDAVLEGGYITDLRTGAATGIAAKYLAREKSKTVAIIGAGNQGMMQIRALHNVFSLSEVRVTDISSDRTDNFVKEMGEELGISIIKTRDPQEAVSEADIIVTVTTANETLVRRDWVARGAFIASVGSYPELDPEIILNADKIVVDNWAQNEHRGELVPLIRDGLLTRENVHGEMSEIVAGRKNGRETEDEIIVACLIGLGCLDVGCASYVYTEAQKSGMGETFDFQQVDQKVFS